MTEKKEEKKKKIQASVTSMERLFRAQLESKLSFQPTAVDLSKLPKFQLPDLKEIQVTVPAPLELSRSEWEMELKERVGDLLLSHAKEVPRKAGEPVQWGDRIRIDLIPYVDGNILSQGIYEGLELLVEPDAIMPGFSHAVVENTAGSTFLLQCTIPVDYPESTLQGKPAAFSITIKEAVELIPPNPEDPEFLTALGMGNSFSEVTDRLLEELQEEKDAEHELEGVGLALEALSECAKSAVTDELLETVLRNQWIQREWKTLQSKGIPEEDCNEALKSWINDAELRSDVSQQLATSLALQAVGIRDGLMQPPAEEFDRFLDGIAEDGEMNAQELRNSLASDISTRDQFYQQFVYTRIVDHVVSQVQIRFARPEF